MNSGYRRNIHNDKCTDGVIRWLALVVLGAVLSGCSSEAFKRMGYTLSTQYSCMESNNHRPDKGVKDLECTNPATAPGLSYDDYKKERNEILKPKE